MSALEGFCVCLKSVVAAAAARVGLAAVFEGATVDLSFAASAAGVDSRESDIVVMYFYCGRSVEKKNFISYSTPDAATLPEACWTLYRAWEQVLMMVVADQGESVVWYSLMISRNRL